MVSRFVNLFKKTDGDEQRAFQRRALAMLCELHPDKEFSISEDPLLLNFGDEKLGLTNIRSNFLLSPQTDNDLREIVAEHFKNVLVGVDLVERNEIGWEKAQPQLMPQLMPDDFLDKLELISFPFGGGIVLGIVVDSHKTYSYVSKSDVERWDVSESEIYDAALENLNDRSNGIEATRVPGPNGYVVVNTMDGFDAVRVTSSDLRNYFGDIIGLPFYFGVPNRDVLICWVKNVDSEFQERMRSQIAKDFDEQPYPLSPSIFEASENGELRQVENASFDARVVSAEYN